MVMYNNPQVAYLISLVVRKTNAALPVRTNPLFGDAGKNLLVYFLGNLYDVICPSQNVGGKLVYSGGEAAATAAAENLLQPSSALSFTDKINTITNLASQQEKKKKKKATDSCNDVFSATVCSAGELQEW